MKPTSASQLVLAFQLRIPTQCANLGFRHLLDAAVGESHDEYPPVFVAGTGNHQFPTAAGIPSGVRFENHYGLRINFAFVQTVEFGVEGVIVAAGRVGGRTFENGFPELVPIRFIATIPRIKPTGAERSTVMPQVTMPRIPSTNEVMARPLVLAGMPAVPAGKGGGVETWNAPPNSGSSESVFHPVAPSAWTRVCALTRPSTIHWCNCSSATGPYSFWSTPMTL